MADYTVLNLESDLRYELEDTDGTQWTDPEMAVYMNDGLIYMSSLLRKYNKYSLIHEGLTRYYIDSDNFSGSNEIDLPENFYYPIELKKDGEADTIRKVNIDKIMESSTQARYTIRGSKVGAPVPNSANTGNNNLETHGEHSGSADQAYTITMTSSTAYSWSGSGSGTGTASTSWTELENGVKIKFSSASGLVSGDSWTFTARATYIVQILRLNYNPTTNLQMEYVRYPTKITTTGSPAALVDAYLPYRRFYLALKEYVKIRCFNRNEMNVAQDVALFAPVEALVMELAAEIPEDDHPDMDPAYTGLDYL